MQRLTRFFLTPGGMAVDKWLVRLFGWSALNSLMARRHGFVAPPVLILATTGHRSGQKRSAVLPYLMWRSNRIVVGSKGGADKDPAWVVNLRHTPQADVTVRGAHHTVVARILGGDERQACWQFIADAMPVYARYQKRTTRQIPLVALEQSA